MRVLQFMCSFTILIGVLIRSIRQLHHFQFIQSFIQFVWAIIQFKISFIPEKSLSFIQKLYFFLLNEVSDRAITHA